MAGGDDADTEPNATGGFEDGNREREAHYPSEGYNLVEISFMRPPGEALTPLGHALRLSTLTIPPGNDFEDYVVYDPAGNAYSRSDLYDGDPSTDDLLARLRSDSSKPHRLALAHLAKRSKDDPACCLSALSLLSTDLQAAAPGVQAERLGILANVAGKYPEQVTPTIDEVLPFLTSDTHPELSAAALSIVSAVADADPSAVVDAVPKLAALLQNDSSADSTLLRAIYRIATAYPDAVVPVVPQLVGYLDEGDDATRTGALAVLGMLSKEYPTVAEETIPTVTGLLESDHYKVRANAAGLLADLADEFPARIEPVVPSVIELLETDDDENVRYNATSILARVAKTHPDAVEPAVPALIAALDESFPFSRSNACWALGYLAAPAALDRLETVASEDPHEEVRQAAAFAVREIDTE